MTRRLLLLLMLIPSSGCMMLEDLLFVDDGPPAYRHYATAEPAQGTCNQAVANVAASQSAEPELSHAQK